MKNRILQMKRMKQTFLLVMLLSVAGMINCFADDYDFSAVCSTGQAMYYKITDNTAHEVQLTYPKYNVSSYNDGWWGGESYGTITVTSYWYNYTKPTGDIVVPDQVMYNGNSYSVTSIRENTFNECSDITSITIPSTVSSLGDKALRSCSGLTEMTILAEIPPTLGGLNVFNGVNKNIPVTVPCGCVESYQNTSVWNEFTNWQCTTETGNHTIDATPNSPEGGMVAGAGNYSQGQTCTLIATANTGYTFTNWMENGAVVSTNATYTFTVNGNRTLSANFAVNIPGTVSGKFTVSDCAQVYFSQGNLQYQASTDTWQFAEHQWDAIGSDNANISPSYEGWIDLFGWGTGDNPTNSSNVDSDYTTFTDWGANPISNGGNTASQWRTLTIEEWKFMLQDRTTNTGIRYAKAKVNGIEGVIILPDDWSTSYYTLSNTDSSDAAFTDNTITSANWYSKFESHGAVFLPKAVASGVSGFPGWYWSSSSNGPNTAGEISFSTLGVGICSRHYHNAVRLVRQVPTFTYYSVGVTPNVPEGGTVSGAGTYEQCETCTLTAVPANGYYFGYWTENGEVVSSNASYSFAVSDNRNLVANFMPQGNAPTGAFDALFTISDTVKVYFSQGNLQYQASSDTWRFAEHQWDYVGNNTLGTVYENGVKSDNALISATYNGWIDLFGWGTGNTPTNISTSVSDYSVFTDWGTNSISNGGNTANQWRTLSYDEWRYLMKTRNTNSGSRFAKATVNGIVGLVILPDDWNNAFFELNSTDDEDADFTVNTISLDDWNNELETHGAVFLPAAGHRLGTSISYVGTNGGCWSSTSGYQLSFSESHATANSTTSRARGGSVRLACPLPNITYYSITATVNPTEGGTVMGAGSYNQGATCTLTATGSEGYTFINWTENGEEVSTEVNYSFTVTGNRSLVANFIRQDNTPTGAINGLFSVGENTQVYFSQGNLQYKASTNTWRFAENQWDYVGENNSNVSETNTGWIDLFGWGTSGWNSGANCYQPWNTGTTNSDYYPGGTYTNDLTGDYAHADWGVHNGISNGGNSAGQWHTLTKDEWEYVFNTRNTPSGIRYAKAQVNGTNGLILLPDSWNDGIFNLNNANTMGADFSGNVIDASEWMGLENEGAVFLPAAGNRNGASAYDAGEFGFYWSTSSYNANYAYSMYFYNSYLNPLNLGNRCFGLSVRLVRSFYDISVISSPAEGGTTTGGGTLLEGSTCTLTATANEGYAFINWTKDGVEVSNSKTYSFMVTGNDTIVANFEKGVAVIGSGTATNVYLPSYSYYKYTLSEQIYTAEEIGDECIVNSIAFYNAGETKTRSYDVYLVHTNKAAFESSSDWIAVTESDLVYSGEFDMNADTWTVFRFDTPFHYDGVSNIALVVDDNTGDWTDSPHMACRVFDADGNQAIRVYSDNTNYDPYNPTGYTGTLLSVKNQIKLGITPTFHFITEGVWSEASNWLVGTLPGAGDVVFIDAPCQLDQNATVDALTVTEGQSLTLQSGQTLTVTNTLTNTSTTSLVIEDGAQLLHASENVSATVKKNIEGHGTRKGKYYLISNPLVSVVNPEQANIYHLTRGNYDLYDWLAGSADSLEWRNFKDYSFMMHPEGYGYLYANQGGVELLFPGVIRRSDISFGKSVSCVADEVFHFNGWNLIGNPFVCDAYLVTKDNEPLPFYRMNAAGNDFEADTSGVIAPMEGVFYVASENDTVYFVRADYTSQMLYTINVSANPIDGGMVSGGGIYAEGQTCTVTAIASEGYIFANWMENDSVVSPQANYQFIVTDNRTLVANFTYVPPTYTISISANPTNGGTVSGGGTYTEGQTCTVIATPNANYTFVSWTENDSVVSTDATYTFTVNADRTLVANFTQNGGDTHAYVDLGLPSGLLWATCNVGADNPEDYGDYFAWGETTTKSTYNWSTYQYCNDSSSTLTKYCNNSSYGYNGFTDNLTTLLPEDDAATANWGSNWRMPTVEEFQELYNNTTVTWTTRNGVKGRLFTAANGKSIFLPAAGIRFGSSPNGAGTYAYYWSSSLYTDNPHYARRLGFSKDDYNMSGSYRSSGISVRPVRSASKN